jgi:outer membrane lipoprotein-sorting protein
MTPKENPKVCPVAPDNNQKDKFADLQKLVTDNASSLERLGIPIIRVGVNKIPIAPFNQYSFTPEEYFKYIGTIIDTPEDVRTLINKPFLKYLENTNLQVKDETITLKDGGGDCDDLSWVAKKFLDILGCKNGFDYQAKVISMKKAHHAVCVFKDKDGKFYSIEQSAIVKGFTTISGASERFSKTYGTDNIEEISLYKGTTLRTQVDPETLEVNYKRLVAIPVTNDISTSTIDNLLPGNWKKHEVTQINLTNGDGLIFKFGILYEHFSSDGKVTFYNDKGQVNQVRDRQGIIEIFDNKGKLIQINEPSGNIILIVDGKEIGIFDKDGNELTKSALPNGETAYKDKDNKTVQITKKDGTIECYDKSGKLTVEFHKDGKKEFFDTDGKITKIIFPDESEKEFDKQGNVAKEKLSDGKIKVFNPDRSTDTFNRYGELIEKQLPNKTVEHYENGKLFERIHPDGRTEFFDKTAEQERTVQAQLDAMFRMQTNTGVAGNPPNNPTLPTFIPRTTEIDRAIRRYDKEGNLWEETPENTKDGELSRHNKDRTLDTFQVNQAQIRAFRSSPVDSKVNIKGVLIRKKLKDGKEESYQTDKDGTLIVHRYYFGDKEILRKVFKDGSKIIYVDDTVTEFFDKKGGKTTKTIQPNGTSEFEKDGIVFKKEYPNKTVDLFNKDGKLIERQNPDGTKEIFKEDQSVELYNEKGRLIQKTMPNGQTIMYNEKGETIERNSN